MPSKKAGVTFVALHSREGISFAFMYLSSILKALGHPVRLILAHDSKDLIRRFAAWPTEVVGMSVTTGLHAFYLDWAWKLKKAFKVHVVLGGPHPTYFPEVVGHSGVDAVCVGEGEEAFVEYLQAYEERMEPFPGPVPGFRHKYAGNIVDGGLRNPVSDLDTLPSPDFRLFFDANPGLARNPVKSFLATRGCPYRCTYCFNREWNARYRGKARVIRVRDPRLVVEEINKVRQQWPLRIVWFLDANFTCNPKWLKGFLPLYRREVGLPFFCKVRPNMVTEELAEALVQGGLTSVGIGIESGNDLMRNEVLERNISREKILKACDAFNRRGVLIMSFNMLGLPGETYPMALETLELNVEAGVDYAMTMLLQPYPGTEIARRAERMGLFDGDFDDVGSSYFCPSPIRFKDEHQRRRIANLQRLMAMAVSFPEIRRHIDTLTALPENPMYLEMFKAYNHHSFHRRYYRAYSTRPPRTGDAWSEAADLVQRLLGMRRN